MAQEISKLTTSDWKKILFRVKDQIGENNVAIVSAGVAFYAFLAIFPAVIAFISIYGLAVNPAQIEQQIKEISSMLPPEAFEILQQQVDNFISKSSTALSWGMAASLLFSIWSSNRGTKGLFTAVNIAYSTTDNRSFLKKNGVTLLFTLCAILLAIVSLTLIVAFPALINSFGLSQTLENVLSLGRWLFLALIIIFFLSSVYKIAPVREGPHWKWVKVGALVATILWLITSWGFSFYVSNFGSYGEIYGSISAVVILLLWLFLTSFIFLLGAQLNSEIEGFCKNEQESRSRA